MSGQLTKSRAVPYKVRPLRAAARCIPERGGAGRSGPYDGGRDARSPWISIRCKVVQLYSFIAIRTVRISSLAMHANYLKIYYHILMSMKGLYLCWNVRIHPSATSTYTCVDLYMPTDEPIYVCTPSPVIRQPAGGGPRSPPRCAAATPPARSAHPRSS